MAGNNLNLQKTAYKIRHIFKHYFKFCFIVKISVKTFQNIQLEVWLSHKPTRNYILLHSADKTLHAKLSIE
jgi:hypothetical protein